MKFAILCLGLLSFLRPVIATAENHAIQLVLYYISYMADELANDPPNYSIAKGCGAEFGVARCNFNQFLQYIWVAKAGDTRPPPTVDVWRQGDPINGRTIQQWQAKIFSWREKVPKGSGLTKRSLLGSTNSQKLVNNAVDFFDALSKVGAPIGQLEAKMATADEATRNANRWIITYGQDLTQWLEDDRFSDMEKFRVGWVRNKLTSAGITLTTKAGRVSQSMAAWQRIDVPGTIRDNVAAGKDAGTVRTEVFSALKAYRTGPEEAKKHFAAMLSATKARLGATCAL